MKRSATSHIRPPIRTPSRCPAAVPARGAVLNIKLSSATGAYIRCMARRRLSLVIQPHCSIRVFRFLSIYIIFISNCRLICSSITFLTVPSMPCDRLFLGSTRAYSTSAMEAQRPRHQVITSCTWIYVQIYICLGWHTNTWICIWSTCIRQSESAQKPTINLYRIIYIQTCMHAPIYIVLIY